MNPSTNQPTTRRSARARRLATCALALGALVLVGCGGKEEDDDPNAVTVHLKPPPNQTVEEVEFENDWDDLDRDKQGRVNAYQKALWVTERYDAAVRLLRLDTPARVQAGQILENLLRRAPQASRARLLLAQLRFSEAAFWFQSTDAWAYQIDWLRYKRTDKDGTEMKPEDIEEAIRKAEPYVAEGNVKIRESASASLRHFMRYRAMRPDDRQISDYVWKLNFFLQNYSAALEWLDVVLRGWDREEVSSDDPLRKDYEKIRQDIDSYLANLELARDDANRRPGSPLPWQNEKLRAEQRLLLSEGRK